MQCVLDTGVLQEKKKKNLQEPNQIHFEVMPPPPPHQPHTPTSPPPPPPPTPLPRLAQLTHPVHSSCSIYSTHSHTKVIRHVAAELSQLLIVHTVPRLQKCSLTPSLNQTISQFLDTFQSYIALLWQNEGQFCLNKFLAIYKLFPFFICFFLFKNLHFLFIFWIT